MISGEAANELGIELTGGLILPLKPYLGSIQNETH